MSVAFIHFFHHSTSLILFSPACLDPFTVSLANALSERKGILVLAVIVVPVNMELRDPVSDVAHNIRKVREMFVETFANVPFVLAVDVV